jgi:SAM-dependent methyltransferase
MITAAPFDSIAASYDALWNRTDAGRAQREAVWRVIDPLFRQGDEILDVGCGTGEDAVHLGRMGVHVSAIDASAEMVKVAASRGVAATQLSVEGLDRIRATYDGVLSNFGALNCTVNLSAVAASLSRLVRPRRHAAICLLNRTCAWEMAWYSARFELRTAFRRLRRDALPTSLGIDVWYPSARDVEHAFAGYFELVHSTGIGVFVPPSYVTLPARAIRMAADADSHWANRPFMRALGDHRLYVFRRRHAC